ncbi:hypothetical protein Sinac_0111 [Singulisphaera acidiphila DSM 18658]|uniref:Uncharacterized protein n=1 Tax=Singulisphaera acidiphila (strain ATCC BAA-1392 / DSM 18658 / VKM B-2454 / MOB10) TaxID=886293 RepID=L0D7G1_SINAD|nr:hypothetical protein Sinac_0111 [Singulisphaera acidiphila DSM 18658]
MALDARCVLAFWIRPFLPASSGVLSQRRTTNLVRWPPGIPKLTASKPHLLFAPRKLDHPKDDLALLGFETVESIGWVFKGRQNDDEDVSGQTPKACNI